MSINGTIIALEDFLHCQEFLEIVLLNQITIMSMLQVKYQDLQPSKSNSSLGENFWGVLNPSNVPVEEAAFNWGSASFLPALGTNRRWDFLNLSERKRGEVSPSWEEKYILL